MDWRPLRSDTPRARRPPDAAVRSAGRAGGPCRRPGVSTAGPAPGGHVARDDHPAASADRAPGLGAQRAQAGGQPGRRRMAGPSLRASVSQATDRPCSSGHSRVCRRPAGPNRDTHAIRWRRHRPHSSQRRRRGAGRPGRHRQRRCLGLDRRRAVAHRRHRLLPGACAAGHAHCPMQGRWASAGPRNATARFRPGCCMGTARRARRPGAAGRPGSHQPALGSWVVVSVRRAVVAIMASSWRLVDVAPVSALASNFTRAALLPELSTLTGP